MTPAVAGDSVAPWRKWLAVLGRSRRSRWTRVERALIGANGKALTMLVTALQARSLLDVKEFADVLGVFSVVVGEDDDLEGIILAVWAGIMKDSL